MSPTEVNDLLDAVARVLARCVVLGFLFLLLWAGAYLLGGDAIYRQGNMFHLAPHEIDLIHYCGMGLVKACVLLLFLFPWVSIRLVLRKRRS